MNLPISIEEQDNGYLGECPILPGCHTEGANYQELAVNLKDAILTYVDGLKDGFISKKTLNKKLFFVNLNKNGEIQTDILKELNKTSKKELSFA